MMFKLGFIVEIKEPLLIVSDETGTTSELDFPDKGARFWATMRGLLENESYIEFDPINKVLYQGGE